MLAPNLFGISKREAKVKSLPESICIQPQRWNTVVDFRKIMKIRHMMVSSEVATAIPANIVATCTKEVQLKLSANESWCAQPYLIRHRWHIHDVFELSDACVAHLVSLACLPQTDAASSL
jgi:hypothetical protein